MQSESSTTNLLTSIQDEDVGGTWDEIAYEVFIVEDRSSTPYQVNEGRARNAIEKAFRIIREPRTHRKYTQQIRGCLDESPVTDSEGYVFTSQLLISSAHS